MSTVWITCVLIETRRLAPWSCATLFYFVCFVLFTIFASTCAVALCYLSEPLFCHLFISHYHTHTHTHTSTLLSFCCLCFISYCCHFPKMTYFICHERRECLPTLACCWRASVLEFSTNVDILLFCSLSFVVNFKLTSCLLLLLL